MNRHRIGWAAAYLPGIAIAAHGLYAIADRIALTCWFFGLAITCGVLIAHGLWEGPRDRREDGQ